MPRHTIFRTEKEIEEIKKIRRQRNTEIQRARRQKLREAKKEKEIFMNNLIKSDLNKKLEATDDLTKEKRKQQNTELQRMRRANLYIPRRKKIAETDEDYLTRRRKRNTEIQRLRRQKLKQQREEKTMFKNLETENNNFSNTENFDASTILTLLQACLVQLHTPNIPSSKSESDSTNKI